jgi:hypothetical protein
MKMPTPGRPESLGRAVDLADARAILSIAAACRKTLRSDRPRSGPIRVLREALWFIWEQPRLPRPLVASKYPRSYPWSPGARAVFAEHAGKRPKGGWGLVIEHLYPRELLVADLLEGAEGANITRSVEVLTERLMAAVVTRDDDRQLPTRAQSARPWDDYAADPWRRYRSTGLQLQDFAPIP